MAETAIIKLNVTDISNTPQKGNTVRVKMNVKYAWYNNEFIKQEEEAYSINSSGEVIRKDGSVGMKLIETDTLTTSTFPETGSGEVWYEIDIVGKHFLKFQVPQGTIESDLKDLPTVEDEY